MSVRFTILATAIALAIAGCKTLSPPPSGGVSMPSPPSIPSPSSPSLPQPGGSSGQSKPDSSPPGEPGKPGESGDGSQGSQGETTVALPSPDLTCLPGSPNCQSGGAKGSPSREREQADGENNPWAQSKGRAGGELGARAEEVMASSEAIAKTSDDPLMKDDPAAVEQAQEAMQEAAEALREAGEAVTAAQTEDDLNAAQDLLADARIAVIIAGQDLAEAQAAIGDDDVFEQAQAVLDQATVAIVEATGVIGMPDLGAIQTASIPRNDRVGDLDEALNESLEIFEGQIMDARQAVLQSDDRASEMPEEIVMPDLPDLPEDPEQGTGNEQSNDSGTGTHSRGLPNTGAPTEVAVVIEDDDYDPSTDDIVAQQLREAAMAETDPELQKKLWEEYKRYKSGQ